LRRLSIEGTIEGLGDLWRHTGLTELQLESVEEVPMPPADAVDMPSLREVSLASEGGDLSVPLDFLALTALTSLCLCEDHWPDHVEAFGELGRVSECESASGTACHMGGQPRGFLAMQ